jgi:multidrug resistance protein
MPEKNILESTRQHTEPDPPFTTFSRRRRIYLTYLLGYLTLASSLTATIYFPLIENLGRYYQTSIQAINLTITLYLVFQAISPAFFGPLSDTLGRRPVFLLTFLVYCAASVGLALNKQSYAALLLLRSLQSVGGSVVMSLAYAVVADISIPAERGKILGPMLAATNLGPCVGPIIGGGVLEATRQVQWCFWTLAIFGTSAFVLLGWTLPETGRMIVGNGSIRARGVWQTWGNCFKRNTSQCSPTHQPNDHTSGINTGPVGKGRLSFPNPFISIRLILHADTFLILWSAGSPYAVWYSIQASIPVIYSQQYGYNMIAVSLYFLSGGLGVIVGGFIAGRLLDMNYEKVAAAHDLPVDRVAGDDIRDFPIELARSRDSYWLHVFSVCALAGYGWTVDFRVHPSVPLIFQFFIGARCTIVLQLFSTLMVDISAGKSGAAGASNNIMRCALSAMTVAALHPLIEGLGNGWAFTLIGFVDGISGSICVWLLQRYGWKWRLQRDCRS